MAASPKQVLFNLRGSTDSLTFLAADRAALVVYVWTEEAARLLPAHFNHLVRVSEDGTSRTVRARSGDVYSVATWRADDAPVPAEELAERVRRDLSASTIPWMRALRVETRTVELRGRSRFVTL